MAVFMAGILLLAVIALLIIWRPFFRRSEQNAAQDYRLKTNDDIYRYQLTTAAKQFQPDEPEFKLLKNELALGLLTEEKEIIQPETIKPTPILLPVLMSVFVVGLSFTTYSFLGNFSAVTHYYQQEKDDPLAELTTEEVTNIRLTQLFDRIKTNPRDDEAWFILTEYYLYNNHFDNALIALNRVKAIRGETNEVLAAEAMILYYQNNQRINSPIQRLLDRILQDDPLQVTALMLMASDFYYRAEFQEAIAIWQKLLDSNNPQIDRIMLIERINVAKMMMNRQ